jgi:hypothetical protein
MSPYDHVRLNSICNGNAKKQLYKFESVYFHVYFGIIKSDLLFVRQLYACIKS